MLLFRKSPRVVTDSHSVHHFIRSDATNREGRADRHARHGLSTASGQVGDGYKYETMRAIGVGGGKFDNKTKVWSGNSTPPKLLFADGSKLGVGEKVRAQYGIGYIDLYENVHQINARLIEKYLQKLFQHLPFGNRLWEQPDAGGKYKIDDSRKHQVFVTFSSKIIAAIKKGELRLKEGK